MNQTINTITNQYINQFGKWLSLHHPSGFYTLVVVEATFPLINLKHFESETWFTPGCFM